MLMQSGRSLLALASHHRIIPVIESRLQFSQVLERTHARALLLHHCNLFELAPLLENALHRGYSVYVNIDHVDGINADAAGLHYLARRFHISGIVSHHPKTLLLAKAQDLETIQQIFAVDSTGLESELEAVESGSTDLLSVSPAPVLPYIVADLSRLTSLPFIGSGLLSTGEQVQAVLRAGALGVVVTRPELWS
ncbi:MAG: glycerol-3-phosphate responsive antiterminator [Ktedonobacteraceae bacterium]|nr:glycerol-3-phosphate responsive antiterminator [Ktedonobacteraceae bacterium]